MSRIAVLKTYKNFVNGEFVRSESGRYYKVADKKGTFIADVCLSSKKDAKGAVVAARGAVAGWSGKTAYNRAQIIYRVAEMLESRKQQFVDELVGTGFSASKAAEEVEAAIETAVYYAGWADKFVQVFSSVNPVASKHFNFSVPEPTGVVAVFASDKNPLSGFLAQILPAVTGGNTVIAAPSVSNPLPALSLGEVFASSDVPHGVINILSGKHEELAGVLSSHMDVNAVQFAASLSKDMIKTAAEQASLNLKRVRFEDGESGLNPYLIMDFQEVKTTWHPIGF